jgi:IS4 transposase
MNNFVAFIKKVTMYTGQYVFTQLRDFLPKRVFDGFVKKRDGDKFIRFFSCWNQLLVMVFAQLSNRASLRDLITTIGAHHSKFHHLGFGQNVTRSNLSKANEQRDPKIFEDFANYMIALARKKRAVKEFFIEGKVYAFDSSTISLCLNVFWWAKFRHTKSGVKLHTLYDVQTDIPAFNIITNANLSDSQVMAIIPYESGSFYVFDRGYMDVSSLHTIDTIHATFVVREKHNMKYAVVANSLFINKETGIMADQRILFTGNKTKKSYPEVLRRVVFYELISNRTFVYYTNNFEITAENVALLYKYRWRVELFYKWIKQHLQIKAFWGTTESAVKIQIYIALITYCLVAIIEHDLNLEQSTYEVLRILNISLLDKTPIKKLFEKYDENQINQIDTQLTLNFL